MIIISLDSIIYNYTAKTNAIFAKNVVIEKNIQILQLLCNYFGKSDLSTEGCCKLYT